MPGATGQMHSRWPGSPDDVTEILKGTEAPLPTTAEDAPMLAALVGIGRITRPEPMVWALVLVEDGLWLIGHELHSPSHRRRRILQWDAKWVKLSAPPHYLYIPTTGAKELERHCQSWWQP